MLWCICEQAFTATVTVWSQTCRNRRTSFSCVLGLDWCHSYLSLTYLRFTLQSVRPSDNIPTSTRSRALLRCFFFTVWMVFKSNSSAPRKVVFVQRPKPRCKDIRRIISLAWPKNTACVLLFLVSFSLYLCIGMHFWLFICAGSAHRSSRCHWRKKEIVFIPSYKFCSVFFCTKVV